MAVATRPGILARVYPSVFRLLLLSFVANPVVAKEIPDQYAYGNRLQSKEHTLGSPHREGAQMLLIQLGS